MSACEKKQEWQLALRWLSRMAEAKVDAETICYSAAISACAKGQEWQLALGLLSRMAEAKVEADTICYTAAIGACEQSHEWQLASDLLSRMAERTWMRRPFAMVRQSVPARRQGGNSHWAGSAGWQKRKGKRTPLAISAVTAYRTQCRSTSGRKPIDE